MTHFCRFRHHDAIHYGILEGDRIQPITGDLFGERAPTGDSITLADSQLLAPLIPGTILAAAVNYQSHVPSGSAVLNSEEAPQVPQLFLKPASSVIGPGETIVLPAEARRVDAEGELVAVIGRECRKVSETDALSYVFGYTCGNDVSARHWQRDDIQWWRAKGSDTFTPLGPVIATGLDPAKLRLRTLVNGEVLQDSATSQLIHGIAKMIAFASHVMTLRPGDLLFTGTPGVPPKLEDGATVSIEIEGIGTLTNSVTRESA